MTTKTHRTLVGSVAFALCVQFVLDVLSFCFQCCSPTTSITLAQTKLVVGVITHPQSKRIPTFMDIVGFELKSNFFDLWFIDGPPESDVYGRNYCLNSNNLDPLREILMKKRFQLLCLQFLTDSSAPWLYRGTDDSWLIPDNARDLILRLEMTYDPYKESIVLGHRVKCYNTFYYQGGAGYLLSRHAVKQIFQYFPQWISSTYYSVDDYSFTSLLRSAGIRTDNVASGFFLGHGFNPFPTQTNLSHLEPCNLSLGELPGPFVGTLNQVAFFHTNIHTFDQAVEIYRFTQSAPPDIKFITNGCHTFLCRALDNSLGDARFVY